MKITTKNIQTWLLGTQFFGTGGGGDPQEALEIYEYLQKEKAFPKILSIKDLPNSGVCITAFGVGDITKAGNPLQPISIAIALLEKFLGQKIVGIIPVEIGPKATATAFLLAALTKLPIIDGDFVGGRSTPEVFLETITLFDIPRTPAVVINQKGNAALLSSAPSAQFEESFFRNFAINSDNQAYVVGYPVTKAVAQRCVTSGTVSHALKMGKILLTQNLKEVLKVTQGKILFQGQIAQIEVVKAVGFTIKNVSFKNDKQQASLFIKNENLMFWIDDQIVLTCPDLLILLNDQLQPYYNEAIKVGDEVIIMGVPAVSMWRTPKGLALFNPSLFGFDEPSTLLSRP